MLDFCCHAVTWTCALLAPYTGCLVADSHAVQVREMLLTFSVVISSSVYPGFRTLDSGSGP